MHTIKATYRVVTPMFCGGATQQPELRLPSFKGVLRFWWRALMWSRVGDLEDLRNQETALFGGSGADSGQSRVILSMTQAPASATLNASEWKANEWENYTGYGLRDAGRKGLPGKSEFTVLVSVRHEKDFTSELIEALRFLGLVGGLGARSRNGWGSITLSKLDGAERPIVPRTKDDVRRELERILTPGRQLGSLPPFTALSAQSEWAVGGEFLSAEAAHRHLGKFYKQFVQNLPKDQTRWQFGIPRQSKRPALRNAERRAKPLFLHVHQAEDAKAIQVALFLPAQFLDGQPDLPNGGTDARELVKSVGKLQ